MARLLRGRGERFLAELAMLLINISDDGLERRMLGCMSAYVSSSWQENREAGETLYSLFLDVFCSSKAPIVDVDLGCRRAGPRSDGSSPIFNSF